MLGSGLLISWGEIYPGREEQVLRLNSEVVAYNGKLLEVGRISAFEPFVLGVHGGSLRGFMIVRGTPEQITTVRHDDEFLSYVLRAQMLIKQVDVEELYFGEELGHVLKLFAQQIGALA
jgi:hypothetical protein